MKIEIISSTVNGTQVNYTCHERIEKWSSWVDVMKLWLGGIIPMTISTIGIIFNILSFIVLRKCQGNKTFKKLLMSLGKIKSKYLHTYYKLNNMPLYFQHAVIAFTFLLKSLSICVVQLYIHIYIQFVMVPLR